MSRFKIGEKVRVKARCSDKIVDGEIIRYIYLSKKNSGFYDVKSIEGNQFYAPMKIQKVKQND